VTFLSSTWAKKPILIGLSIHFTVWWAGSVLFWAKNYGSYVGLYFAPIAPIYLGIAILKSPENREWAAAGMVVFFALVGTISVAVRKQSGWTVVLAHFAVLLYWFTGFALMSPVP
jgi:hypothetical protein